MNVRLTRIQMEAREKERSRQAELEYQLQVKRLEIEADKAVQLRQLELASQKEAHTLSASTGAGTSFSSTSSIHNGFDVSKHIALVPTFRET